MAENAYLCGMQTQIIDTAVAAGQAKAAKATTILLTQAMMAGAFVSLGGLLSVYLGFGFPGLTAENPGLQRLLSGLAFPIGLFLIVLFGGELFTGNNAVLIPALARRHYGWATVVRNWTLVWLGNLAGALLFTYFFVIMAGLADASPWREAFQNIAVNKAGLDPLKTVVRGIGANWCVCLAVWLGMAAKTMPQKALACWLPVGTFVVLGYEHSIANMFFIPCGMLAGADVSLAAAASNILWATLGNILGGALLVGAFFHRLYGRGS